MVQSITASLYTYRGKVTEVYDGDTITVDVDYGMGVWRHGLRFRLARINAPEMRPKKVIMVNGKKVKRTLEEREEIKRKAVLSRDWLRELILDQEVIIKTEIDSTGKYGRYIVEVYFKGRNINDILVDLGYAVYREY